MRSVCLLLHPLGGIAIRRVCWCVCVFVNTCWIRISRKRLETRHSVTMEHFYYEMACGKSNGHMLDDVT